MGTRKRDEIEPREWSRYDLRAWQEISDFKNPKSTGLRRFTEAVGRPFRWLGERALDNRVGEAVAKAVHGVVGLMNDGAAWSVRTGVILDEFRKDGHAVTDLDSVRNLELEDADRTVGYLAAKYKGAAALEGAAAGALGLPGIVLDVPTVAGMALRAVNEYATYYGFDVALPGERSFSARVLVAASSPTMASKQIALMELTKISVEVARRKTWQELGKYATVVALKQLFEAVGIRLTKAKLAAAVPVVGGFVSGGFNAWYLATVTETASMVYRERYLLERYGAGPGEERAA